MEQRRKRGLDGGKCTANAEAEDRCEANLRHSAQTKKIVSSHSLIALLFPFARGFPSGPTSERVRRPLLMSMTPTHRSKRRRAHKPVQIYIAVTYLGDPDRYGGLRPGVPTCHAMQVCRFQRYRNHHVTSKLSLMFSLKTSWCHFWPRSLASPAGPRGRS